MYYGMHTSILFPVFPQVLFFIDPEYLKDKRLKPLREVTLSYNFFKTDEDEDDDEDDDNKNDQDDQEGSPSK